MNTKPPRKQPTPAQDDKAETRLAPAALVGRGDPPVTEILRRLEQIADKLEAICNHIPPTQIDDSLASALFSRMDTLEEKLNQLFTQGSESASSSALLDVDRQPPESDRPPEPGVIALRRRQDRRKSSAAQRAQD